MSKKMSLEIIKQIDFSEEVERFLEEVFITIIDAVDTTDDDGQAALENLASVICLLQNNNLSELPDVGFVQENWEKLDQSRFSVSKDGVAVLLGCLNRGRCWLENIVSGALLASKLRKEQR